MRALIIAALCLPSLALAHARLVAPTPRNNSDLLKDPNGPCGNVARTLTPAVFTQGQTITVNFTETVNHTGCFLLSLSPANDQNFQQLMVVPHSNMGGTPRQYSVQLALPAGVACQDCTFQLVQVMQAANLACPPAVYVGTERYYSCADVRITAPVPDGGGTGGGSGSDSGVPDAGGTGGGAGGGAGGAGGAGGGAGGAGGTGGTGGGDATGGGGGDATGGGSGTGTGTGGGGPLEDRNGGVAGGCSTTPVAFGFFGLLLLLGVFVRRGRV